jgi:hypothetical protein
MTRCNFIYEWLLTRGKVFGAEGDDLLFFGRFCSILSLALFACFMMQVSEQKMECSMGTLSHSKHTLTLGFWNCKFNKTDKEQTKSVQLSDFELHN